MKINWILPEVTQCGGVRVALEYANMLTDMGHDVVCYAPQSGQHYGLKRIIFVKEVLRMKRDGNFRGEWFSNKFRFEFPMWINNKSIRDADITIATSWITAYWVDNLQNTKGKKVYFIQGFETWGNKKYNEIVLNTYSLPFDLRITVSTALHNRLLRETGADSKIVCNGVEECFLKETKKDWDNISIGMPYREEACENDVKNCSLGIRVLLRIKEKYPHIRLCSFGFNKPDNWNENIEFLENPTRDELVEFYNSTNIFYVPSLYEGWGLPAMEAMGQENVVVAAKSGLIEEIGVDGENCIILDDPADENKSVILIEQLIHNRDNEQIGKNARSVISKMTDNNSARKFEDILSEMLEPRGEFK